MVYFAAKLLAGDACINLALRPADARQQIREVKRRVWRALAQLHRASSGWVPWDAGTAPAILRLELHRCRTVDSPRSIATPATDVTPDSTAAVPPATSVVVLLCTLLVKTAEQDAEERALQVQRDASATASIRTWQSSG